MNKKIGNPAAAAALLPLAADIQKGETEAKIERAKRGRPESTKDVVLTAIDDIPPLFKGILVVAVVGGIGYGIVRLIKKIKESAAQKEIKKAEETTGEDNPWSANSFLSQRIPSNVQKLSATSASELATQLYKCFDVWFDEDEEEAVSIFTRLRSKYEVAQVVKAYEDKYKIGVLKTLKEGFHYLPNAGLSEDDYKLIMNNVANKSKF